MEMLNTIRCGTESVQKSLSELLLGLREAELACFHATWAGLPPEYSNSDYGEEMPRSNHAHLSAQKIYILGSSRLKRLLKQDWAVYEFDLARFLQN